MAVRGLPWLDAGQGVPVLIECMGDDRARWDDYQAAYEAMLRATSRPYAPWYAIPADDKDYMRAAVARILVETLEHTDPRYPRLSAVQRKELQQGRRRLLAE